MRYVCLLAPLSLGFLYAGQVAVVRGELTCGECSSYTNMVIEVADTTRQRITASGIDNNGSFEFYNVPEGTYYVTVKTSRGEAIAQEVVSVRQHAGPFSVRLPEQEKRERPVSGVVSVARLKHKPPKKAKKEYEKGESLFAKGDVQGSLDHLKRATEIDSEYIEAFNNMGSRYMALERPAEALSAFHRALELDPSSELVQVNVAIALIATKDIKAAEDSARRTLATYPRNLKARYVLGLALYSQKITTDEALEALQSAQTQFPNARLAAASILAMRGERAKAKGELKSYLAGNPANRQQAEMLLATLQD